MKLRKQSGTVSGIFDCHLLNKNPKIRTPEKIVVHVVILKIKQCGFIKEYCA